MFGPELVANRPSIHLKPDVDLAMLDAAAAAETDLEAARRVLFLRIAAGMAPAQAAG